MFVWSCRLNVRLIYEECCVNSVCVFAGSNRGGRPEYAAAATALGEAIATRGWTLVFGGGKVGLMGVVADAALAAGGQVIGVIPQALASHELAHVGLSKLHVVASMHERKAVMADQSDGMIALPGGLGTFEEWFEVLTWNQLGLHAKPCAVLNVAGYYDGLLGFLNHAVDERFVHRAHRDMIIAEAEPNALLDAMAAYQAPSVVKWLDREAR